MKLNKDYAEIQRRELYNKKLSSKNPRNQNSISPRKPLEIIDITDFQPFTKQMTRESSIVSYRSYAKAAVKNNLGSFKNVKKVTNSRNNFIPNKIAKIPYNVPPLLPINKIKKVYPTTSISQRPLKILNKPINKQALESERLKRSSSKGDKTAPLEETLSKDLIDVQDFVESFSTNTLVSNSTQNCKIIHQHLSAPVDRTAENDEWEIHQECAAEIKKSRNTTLIESNGKLMTEISGTISDDDSVSDKSEYSSFATNIQQLSCTMKKRVPSPKAFYDVPKTHENAYFTDKVELQSVSDLSFELHKQNNSIASDYDSAYEDNLKFMAKEISECLDSGIDAYAESVESSNLTTCEEVADDLNKVTFESNLQKQKQIYESVLKKEGIVISPPAENEKPDEFDCTIVPEEMKSTAPLKEKSWKNDCKQDFVDCKKVSRRKDIQISKSSPIVIDAQDKPDKQNKTEVVKLAETPKVKQKTNHKKQNQSSSRISQSSSSTLYLESNHSINMNASGLITEFTNHLIHTKSIDSSHSSINQESRRNVTHVTKSSEEKKFFYESVTDLKGPSTETSETNQAPMRICKALSDEMNLVHQQLLQDNPTSSDNDKSKTKIKRKRRKCCKTVVTEKTSVTIQMRNSHQTVSGLDSSSSCILDNVKNLLSKVNAEITRAFGLANKNTVDSLAVINNQVCDHLAQMRALSESARSKTLQLRSSQDATGSILCR